MDITTFIIGFVVGAIISGAVVYFMKANASPSSNISQSEAELKGVLAAQAREHIDDSVKLINEIEQSAQYLRSKIGAYEASLSESDFQEDDSKSTFFGEHASVYLRNSVRAERTAISSSESGNQPRDFSNNASGLFAGAPVVSEDKDQKIDK